MHLACCAIKSGRTTLWVQEPGDHAPSREDRLRYRPSSVATAALEYQGMQKAMPRLGCEHGVYCTCIALSHVKWDDEDGGEESPKAAKLKRLARKDLGLGTGS